jgi:hypothetical protein
LYSTSISRIRLLRSKLLIRRSSFPRSSTTRGRSGRVSSSSDSIKEKPSGKPVFQVYSRVANTTSIYSQSLNLKFPTMTYKSRNCKLSPPVPASRLNSS